jgi:hypothetical protein
LQNPVVVWPIHPAGRAADAVLPIVALQFVLAIRFRSFLTPLGIGGSTRRRCASGDFSLPWTSTAI